MDDDRVLDRLEGWKRRLLDLTLRNKLLNFKPGRNAVGIGCADSAALEDRLSAGRGFPADAALGRPRRIGRAQPRAVPEAAPRRRPPALPSRSARTRRDLHDALGKELDDRLLDLFRLARNGFEEGGANILFLAIGFLSWTRKEGKAPYRAPLLLVPVSLKRSSVRAGSRLSLHDDDARFNLTLIELLRQEFELRMPEFAGDLPRDASGLDVERILMTVRSHIRDLKGWEVLPDAVLSAFSSPST